MSENSSGASTSDSCRVCGGDGRLENAWGQVAKCPSCHGNGRRAVDTGFHDVTKTKPSHHQQTNRAAVVAKQIWPTTASGMQLATEIRDSGLDAAAKDKVTREIMEHEATHGLCTQTFSKKVRKQIRPAAAR